MSCVGHEPALRPPTNQSNFRARIRSKVTAGYNPAIPRQFMSVQLTPAPVMAGAEPFRFDAPGTTACLLVHGFTRSAFEVRELGRHLAECGVSARGLLLSGHGTRPEDMTRFSYRDWIADVEAALEELLSEGKRVFLCGLSM